MAKSESIAEALERAEFDVEVYAEQDDIPVRGNALASGDDEEDRKAEDDILERLESGDVWAWASVRVVVSHPLFPQVEGDDYLGGCSYASEADFRQRGGYFDDMVRAALTEWLDATDESRKVERAAVRALAESLI